jgi:hypothetical protein
VLLLFNSFTMKASMLLSCTIFAVGCYVFVCIALPNGILAETVTSAQTQHRQDGTAQPGYGVELLTVNVTQCNSRSSRSSDEQSSYSSKLLHAVLLEIDSKVEHFQDCIESIENENIVHVGVGQHHSWRIGTSGSSAIPLCIHPQVGLKQFLAVFGFSPMMISKMWRPHVLKVLVVINNEERRQQQLWEALSLKQSQHKKLEQLVTYTDGSVQKTMISSTIQSQSVALLCSDQDTQRIVGNTVSESDGDSGFVEAAALIEEAMASFPFADKVFKAVMAPVAHPTANNFVEATTEHVLEPASQVASHYAAEAVPPHVTQMLMETVPYNVTNLLQDSLTYEISKHVTKALWPELSKYLIPTIPKALSPRLHTSLFEIFNMAIPTNINRVLSTNLYRTLLPKLMNTMSRTLAHSITPALSQSVTPTNADTDKFCQLCYQYQMHCSKCHYSAESNYYTAYHSSFYSDYYAKYYSQYYAKAIEEVDKEQFQHGVVETPNYFYDVYGYRRGEQPSVSPPASPQEPNVNAEHTIKSPLT